MLVLLFSLLTHFNPALKIHIETSHLICTVNQMIGFYMKYNAGLKWIKLDFYRNFRPLSLKLQITEGPALPTHTLCLWDKIPFLFSAEKLNNESLLNIEISRNSFHVACNALKSSKVKKTSQQIFTCSKSTIETIVKGVKYVQSFWCLYWLLWTYSTSSAKETRQEKEQWEWKFGGKIIKIWKMEGVGNIGGFFTK